MGNLRSLLLVGVSLCIHKFLNKPWRGRGRWHENRTRVKNIYIAEALVLSYIGRRKSFLRVCVCLLSHETKKRLWWEGERKTIQLAVVPHYMLCCIARCVGVTAAAATAQRAFSFAFSTTVRIPQRDDRMIKRHKNPRPSGGTFWDLFFRTNFFFLFFC